MRTRVDRLRLWLVACSLGLLVLVGVFLGYARFRSRAFLAGLPGRLGVNITRETDGYTYSQTVEGRTVFTLHAVKMEQRSDGLVKLHDVGVVVYGRQQNRADRIYGKEFEYDQAAGIVRALGIVNLDLQAPAPAEGKKQRPLSASGGALTSTDARVIHVTTSGLVYLTKLGVAATGEDVEFTEGAMTGHSRGAEFSSDTGMVVLQSAVRVNGLTASGPIVITASRAELDRNHQTVDLAGAKLVTTSETVDAEHSVVYVRKDGSPERVEGSGGVSISRAEGGILTAAQGEATLNEAGKPADAHFGGAVRLTEDEGPRHIEGQANEARMHFDPTGQPEHVTMTGGVSMLERESGTIAKAASRKTLTGKVVEVALGAAAGKGHKSEIRDAHAVGMAKVAVLTEAQPGGKAGEGPSTTDLIGDDMKAHFASGQRLANLVAVGHTELHQVNGLGVDERSAADTTEMVFSPRSGGVTAGPAKPTIAGPADVQSAVQTGHIAMVRSAVKVQGGKPIPDLQRATAERASFDGAANQVTLTGDVVLGDAASTLWSAKVVVERASGDATAEGGVRLSYLQASGDSAGEPMHVLADHALLRRGLPVAGATRISAAGARVSSPAADTAFFYGNSGKPARMWQGGSQVEAPVLELEQASRRLTASGTGSGPQVQTVLVSASQPAGPAAKSGGLKGRSAGAVRVRSHALVYSDDKREANFTGGVLVEDADGRMRAEQATAFLQARSRALDPGERPAAAAPLQGAKGAPEPFLGGNLERIVAAGKVELDQPGRHGTGEELVYTASDGLFVLTGTAAVPPRMTDEARGTVTGASLRFHSGDDSVVVTSSGIERGADLKAARKPVRTETRVKQQ